MATRKQATKAAAKKAAKGSKAAGRGEARRESRGEEVERRPMCSLTPEPQPVFSPDIAPGRMRAILETSNKWVNGTTLHYYFFDRDSDGETVFFANGTSEFRSWVGGEEQKAVVRRSFAQWKELGIGLNFEEVNSRHEAELRIGFMRNDGSWSKVGRAALDVGANKRTMNFGWDLRRPDGPDTAIHEIGHAIGLKHEHQNPNAGIVWNEEAVYAALAEPPNEWDRETTHYNIIRKLPPDTVQGSSWDPNSIMHYPFEAGLIRQPERYAQGLTPGGGLSERDRAWVRSFYPPLDNEHMSELQPARSEQLPSREGEQQSFRIRPESTRYYDIRTFGACDTVVVLFEDEAGDLRYLTADDDSGEDRNASLRVKLFSGREYVLRVRVNYLEQAAPPALMIW